MTELVSRLRLRVGEIDADLGRWYEIDEDDKFRLRADLAEAADALDGPWLPRYVRLARAAGALAAKVDDLDALLVALGGDERALQTRPGVYELWRRELRELQAILKGTTA